MKTHTRAWGETWSNSLWLQHRMGGECGKRVATWHLSKWDLARPHESASLAP